MTTIKTQRIKHTVGEIYKVYSYLPCKSDLFKDIKRWYYYKGYHTKQAALNGIKRFKNKSNDSIAKNLIWKIVWCPYPFASVEDCIVVYSEEL